jgi:hypothetical protein
MHSQSSRVGCAIRFPVGLQEFAKQDHEQRNGRVPLIMLHIWQHHTMFSAMSVPPNTLGILWSLVREPVHSQ